MSDILGWIDEAARFMKSQNRAALGTQPQIITSEAIREAARQAYETMGQPRETKVVLNAREAEIFPVAPGSYYISSTASSPQDMPPQSPNRATRRANARRKGKR